MAEQRKSRILRIDDELYEVLAAWAQEEDRPINTHMIRLLRQAATDAGRWPVRHTGSRLLHCADSDTPYQP